MKCKGEGGEDSKGKVESSSVQSPTQTRYNLPRNDYIFTLHKRKYWGNIPCIPMPSVGIRNGWQDNKNCSAVVFGIIFNHHLEKSRAGVVLMVRLFITADPIVADTEPETINAGR